MADPQVTLRELLQDPVYKQWFRKPPNLGDQFVPSGRPWRVYIQRQVTPDRPEGKWGRADFQSYAKAANFLIGHLRSGAHDGALTCPSHAFHPPVLVSKEPKRVLVTVQLRGGKTKKVRRYAYQRYYWRPAMELYGHQWCPYCRRPTVFAYFSRHHALPTNLCLPYELRCSICGVRRTFIKDYWAISKLAPQLTR